MLDDSLEDAAIWHGQQRIGCRLDSQLADFTVSANGSGIGHLERAPLSDAVEPMRRALVGLVDEKGGGVVGLPLPANRFSVAHDIGPQAGQYVADAAFATPKASMLSRGQYARLLWFMSNAVDELLTQRVDQWQKL